jgi:hypothetical protein
MSHEEAVEITLNSFKSKLLVLFKFNSLSKFTESDAVGRILTTYLVTLSLYRDGVRTSLGEIDTDEVITGPNYLADTKPFHSFLKLFCNEEICGRGNHQQR